MDLPKLLLLLLFLPVAVAAQSDTDSLTAPIVAEGKLLYRSEMASWYGTDLFMERYPNTGNIGGYFSYGAGSGGRCIFFSKDEHPIVIGTVTFDSTYNVKTAALEMKERPFSEPEAVLYGLREAAEHAVRSDTFFKSYQGSGLNLIPVVSGGERKVYILSGAQENGVVIFGNDYLLTFDTGNRILTRKRLHRNILPIRYGKAVPGGSQEGAMHTHLPETGDFITATDICTLMLYERFTGWETYNVVSERYLSIWNCATDSLLVITMEAVNRINADQEQRQNKGKNRKQ